MQQKHALPQILCEVKKQLPDLEPTTGSIFDKRKKNHKGKSLKINS